MLAGLSALLAAICFSTSPAHATLVEGSFDGFATGFGTYETFLHLNGSQMTGSFSYDTAAAVQTGTNTFTFTSGAEITIESGGLHEHAVATAALPITLRLGINFGISGGQAGVADGNPLDGFAPTVHLSSLRGANLTEPPIDDPWLPLMDQQTAAWQVPGGGDVVEGFTLRNFELHAVPEPGTHGLLLGPLAIGLARRAGFQGRRPNRAPATRQ